MPSKISGYKGNQKKLEMAWGYLMIAPTMLGLLILNIFPIFQTFYLSFTKTGAFGKSSFIGIQNYVDVLKDKLVMQSFINTFKYTILVVPLGVFLSLIVVNCIVLGRAEAFASKNSIMDSFLDAIGVSIGFGISLIIMASFREILGTGELKLKSLFDSEKVIFHISMFKNLSASFFTSGAGAFLSFGILAGLFNIYKDRKQVK